MWLGIDVGGTFTDAVLLKGGVIQRQIKVPTDSGQILESILSALDAVLEGIDPFNVERVAFSTTLVTNAIIAEEVDPVGLLIMPGPGADWHGRLAGEPVEMKGYVDHRGRVRQEMDERGLRKVCQEKTGLELFAVSGKFSARNPSEERRAAKTVMQEAKPLHITLGSVVSGSLNFIRRTNSAYYNAGVWKKFRNFADGAEAALARRGIKAPVFILKADGGTLPLSAARECPIESIFTGPAASILGIMALCPPEGPAISLDIGGTTTDIALWNHGAPIFGDKGASIAGYLTAVRTFRLRSIGLGGDSWVRRDAGKLIIGPQRKGSAMALGGPVPTVTDALIVAGHCEIGSSELAEQALKLLTLPGESYHQTAREILDRTVESILSSVNELLDAESMQPVYRVEDIVHAEMFTPQTIVGVGGGASGLVPIVAERMGLAWNVPQYAMVANAVGAALARPTLDITLRADTSQGEYTVPELGLRRSIIDRRFSLPQAREAAAAHLNEFALTEGISATAIESIREEEFNIVRGFSTLGRIITVHSQIKPGVIARVSDTGGGQQR